MNFDFDFAALPYFLNVHTSTSLGTMVLIIMNNFFHKTYISMDGTFLFIFGLPAISDPPAQAGAEGRVSDFY